MEQILQKLMDMGIGEFMDKSRQKLCMSDTVYLRDMEDERELEQRYTELDLSRHQRLLVNDYVACMETVRNRYADISYAAGVTDVIKILVQSGLLNGIKLSEENERDVLKICNM